MLDDYSWDMTGYIPKYGFHCLEKGLTRLEAERTFQLNPEPPQADNINDYIVMANREKELRYLCFFLHHYEKMLNGRLYRFFHREGFLCYNPERFLNYKLGCLSAILNCLPGYDPSKGTDFLTYAYYDIGNAILDCRRYEEAGSFKNLEEYKTVRGIAWLYSKSGDSRKKTLAAFMKQTGCTKKTAESYLTAARKNRSRAPFYVTAQDENSEETGEDVSRDDSWNHGEILCNGVRMKAVQRAFDKLDYREQSLLERHNAACMGCGHVKPWDSRPSWEELAVMFEGTTASGAERAYKKAVWRLAALLVEEGFFHTIRLKRTSQKMRKRKIVAATYQYQADCDGEWGEIQFDFENRTVEIMRLADWDKMISRPFAKYAISYLLNCKNEKLPKETVISFEM